MLLNNEMGKLKAKVGVSEYCINIIDDLMEIDWQRPSYPNLEYILHEIKKFVGRT